MKISKLQLLFILYMLAVVVASLMPSEEFVEVKYLDKLVHFIMYFIMALLALTAFPSGWPRTAAVIATYGLGFLLEWGQGFVDVRTPSIMDNAANFVGASMGILFYYLWKKVKRSLLVRQVD